MKNRKIAFVIKALALSIPFFYLWDKFVADFYLNLVGSAAQPVALFLDSRLSQMFLWNEFTYIIPPFLTLCLALKAPLLSKLFKIEIGTGIIFIWHILLLAILNFLVHQLVLANQQTVALPYIFASVINLTAPFLTWVGLFSKEIQFQLGS